MNEKRFTLSEDTEWWFVRDNTIQVNEHGYREDLGIDGLSRGIKQELTEQEVVDLLNQLLEENEQLKKELQKKADLIDEVWRKYEIAHGMSIDNTDWF